jgi:hypothetical protein
MLCSSKKDAVPPVEMISISSEDKVSANRSNPVLSETLIKAFFTLITVTQQAYTSNS